MGLASLLVFTEGAAWPPSSSRRFMDHHLRPGSVLLHLRPRLFLALTSNDDRIKGKLYRSFLLLRRTGFISLLVVRASTTRTSAHSSIG